MKQSLAALWIVVALVTASADCAVSREHRGRDHDQDVARRALQRGEVLPISRLLTLATRYIPGDVVEVRLEPRQSGDIYYRLKVLTPSGRIRELVLDARTGDYIDTED